MKDPVDLLSPQLLKIFQAALKNPGESQDVPHKDAGYGLVIESFLYDPRTDRVEHHYLSPTAERGNTTKLKVPDKFRSLIPVAPVKKSKKSSLRASVIRLAHENPDLRPHLLLLLK